MKLIFSKIKIKNVLSFDEEEFDFSKSTGMTLVCGKNNDIGNSSNGAGKSSLFSCLLYALFGQLQTKIKNENIKNRYTVDKGMFVSLDFSIDGTATYRINRGLNKNGASFFNLYNIDATGAEVDLTKSSIIETQLFLEREVIHCDISIFLRTILLTSDQNYNFFRLRPQPKKEFIEKLFNISIFGEIYSLIHRDVLDLDKAISIKENNLLVLSNNEDIYLNKLSAFNTELTEKLNVIKTKIENLLIVESQLKNTEITCNKQEISSIEEKLTKLNDAATKLNLEIRKIKTNIQQIDTKQHKLETKKQELEKIISKHQTLIDTVCDDCKQIVSDFYDLTTYTTNINKIITEHSNLETTKNTLDNTLSDYNNKLNKITEKTAEFTRNISDLTSATNELNLKIVKCESELNVLKSEKRKLENEVNPYTDLYEKNHEKILVENENLNQLNEKLKYLKCSENIVSQDTLKKFIIKDLVGLLNSKLKYYLAKLGANYTCVFDENMFYTFLTEGGECEYDNFSAGERMRLTIAASFAFRDFMATRNNLTSNILILDEYIDSNIDQLAISGILDILKNYALIYQQQVFIISHRKEIDNSVFNNIIQIVKTNNISKIKYLPVN